MPCETDLIILKLLFNDDKVRSIQALIINGNPARFIHIYSSPYYLTYLPTCLSIITMFWNLFKKLSEIHIAFTV